MPWWQNESGLRPPPPLLAPLQFFPPNLSTSFLAPHARTGAPAHVAQPECPSHPLGRERRSLSRGSEACEREGHSPGWGRAEEEGLTPWWPARQAATRSFQPLGPRDLPSHMTSSRISWKMVGDPRQSQARPRCQCHQEAASRIQALPGRPEAAFRMESGALLSLP